MKKLVVASLCLICSIFSIQAQNSVAIRSGVNLGSQTITINGESLDYENITGLSGTLAFRTGLGEHFAIQPELSYLQKGSSFELSVLGQSIAQKTRMDYLEIPILLVYQPVNKDNIGIGIFAGPSFGIGIGGQIEINDIITDINWSEDESLNRTEFSLAFGADAQFGIGSGKLVLDVRYLTGVSNVANSEATEEGELRNNGFGVSLGYAFPIGGQ